MRWRRRRWSREAPCFPASGSWPLWLNTKSPFSDDEATESLTQKLAQFYADRTLTHLPITPADQAEAFYLLLTNRLSKTTGQVITVDGGLIEAFLR